MCAVIQIKWGCAVQMEKKPFSPRSFEIHSSGSVCDCNLMMNWEVILLGHTFRCTESEEESFFIYGATAKSQHHKAQIT